jgi:hypothetical protein
MRPPQNELPAIQSADITLNRSDSALVQLEGFRVHTNGLVLTVTTHAYAQRLADRGLTSEIIWPPSPDSRGVHDRLRIEVENGKSAPRLIGASGTDSECRAEYWVEFDEAPNEVLIRTSWEALAMASTMQSVPLDPDSRPRPIDW